MGLADRAGAGLERSVLPAVIARGAGLRVTAVEDGVARLEVSGSPGAVLPLASRIEALIRPAVPDIPGVRIPGLASVPPPGSPTGTPPHSARRLLSAGINTL